ncbi:hypothetical protein ACRW9N_10900 [Listeria aquatica]|uniref:hypothetical protein n=1 Tax=Listeria aquatica TaxID=1494960 RepID=UPI003EF42612
MKVKVIGVIVMLIVVGSLGLWWTKTQEVRSLQKGLDQQKQEIQEQTATIQSLQKQKQIWKQESDQSMTHSNGESDQGSVLQKNQAAIQAYFNYDSLQKRDQQVQAYLTASFSKESEEAEDSHDHEQSEVASKIHSSEAYLHQDGDTVKTYTDLEVTITSQAADQDLHLGATFTWKKENGNWLISKAHFQTLE